MALIHIYNSHNYMSSTNMFKPEQLERKDIWLPARPVAYQVLHGIHSL